MELSYALSRMVTLQEALHLPSLLKFKAITSFQWKNGLNRMLELAKFAEIEASVVIVTRRNEYTCSHNNPENFM